MRQLSDFVNRGASPNVENLVGKSPLAMAQQNVIDGGWVDYDDLTVLPKHGIMVYLWEIIPFYGRTILVSGIYFNLYTQINDHNTGNRIMSIS